MIRLLLSLVLFLYAPQAAAAPPTILVLGDSLSAGHGIDPKGGWVSLLQRRLHKQGYPYRVINASISGATTRGGLTRLPRALAQHQPRVVIVELGGNDGLRGLSLDEIRRNLAAIIERSQQGSAKVLLLGVRLPPNYGEVYVKKFHTIFRNLEQSYTVPLVPFLLDGVGGHEELMQSDSLHPNTQAQGRMLDNVWPHLIPLLHKSSK
ncbi:MAG: arylesterase [Acidiferrobacterales bacterium]